jgi:aryl carrier-like protein
VIDEARLKEELSELLETPIEEIGDDDNLLDHGLDSIRIMGLAEAWSAAGGQEIAFADLAEAPQHDKLRPIPLAATFNAATSRGLSRLRLDATMPRAATTSP